MKYLLVIWLSILGCSGDANAEDIFHEDGFYTVNGVELYYEVFGEGEPFILLHGGPGMYHDELVPFFMEFAKTHQVIFYDQRGNGKSIMENVNSTTFSTELLVDDIEGLRQAFGIDKLNIIGHSWGGLLSLYYAAKYPENVKRVIAISAAPVNLELLIASYENLISRFSSKEWQYIEGLWNSEEYHAGNPDIHNEAMRLSEGRNFYDPSYVDELMAAASFSAETAVNALALAGLGRDMKLGVSGQERLANITAPTLIINGRQDFIVTEAPELAHELIKNSKLVWIEESGHYPYIEQPRLFFSELEAFIEETAQP